uniref:Aa_trans domain-containing protein n=1 Tax=Heterorhabditis bacteriophora TaxID=37862 RepID=A0A1I7XKD8_HETBA
MQWVALNIFPKIHPLNEASHGSALHHLISDKCQMLFVSELTVPLSYTFLSLRRMNLVTIIYTLCGFFGYITYGNEVHGSITLNLRNMT